MDFELEVAFITSTETALGTHVSTANAEDHIIGLVLFNDWSARDLQMLEMKTNFGPVKSKDFAASYGPVIVTLDSLVDRATGRPGVYDLSMTAKINGKEVSRGNFSDIYWSFGDILARVSQSVILMPGDVIGSGTVGTGCLYELTKNQGPWLNEGDIVELEIEEIGILTNTVGKKNK